MVDLSFGAIIALLIGVAEVIKGFGLNPKYIPVLNLLLGVVACVTWKSYLSLDIGIAVFEGLIAGLSASGLYSGVKNVVEGIQS